MELKLYAASCKRRRVDLRRTAIAACLVDHRVVALDVVTWSVRLVHDRHITTSRVNNHSLAGDRGTTCTCSLFISPSAVPRSYKFRSAVSQSAVQRSLVRLGSQGEPVVEFLARDVIYTSHAYATMSVFVCLSATEVHWRIIANLGFKFRSQFTAHCGRGACGREEEIIAGKSGGIISRYASHC